MESQSGTPLGNETVSTCCQDQFQFSRLPNKDPDRTIETGSAARQGRTTHNDLFNAVFFKSNHAHSRFKNGHSLRCPLTG